ncbi:autotransporter-associated beta strand repeat-containing protein [Prosthecobacter sp. SYSU 5D2]|uniref:beta strand repeat-containing protein n=1 Tax=Prosthecobacter sp. SYSU 5D2 TaxID=3134134 RepID=UPI0031FEA1D8
MRPLKNLLILPVIAGSLLMNLHAADFFWDADAAMDGSQNGSGEWSSAGSPLNWTAAPALTGSSNVPWVNATDSIAHLGAADGYTNAGTGGSLTLGENITLNQLRMGAQAGAYSILPGAGSHGLIFSGTAPVLHNESAADLTLQAGWQAAGGLVKTGSGRVILSAPAGGSTGTGSLAIHEGGVTLNAADTLPTGMALVLGNENTAGTLDVGFDQTAAGLSFQSRSSGATNSVTIAEGVTLTVNGALITGIVDGTAAGGSTLATMQGGGNLVVNHATGSFIVSSGAKAGGSTDFNTLDLAGLTSFTANVNRFDVGRSTNATGSFQAGRPSSTLTLAASNSITAGTLVIGANSQTTLSSFMNLGQENILHTDRLVLGVGRASATLRFGDGLSNPTLILRGTEGGSSRSSVTLGDSRNITAVGSTGGSSQPNGIVNLTDGTVDLMMDTLTIAVGGTDSGSFNGGTYGRGLGTFSFGGEDSLLDVNSLIIAKAANSNTNALNTPDTYLTTIGTLNMSGGSLIVNTRFVLGLSEDGATGNHQDSSGTFNLTGGSVIVGTADAPVDIELGDHDSDGGGTGIGVLNLTGGSMSVFGNIRRGSTGLTNGSLTLDGTSLNLNGGSIGDAAQPVTLSLQSGALANVGEINGGGALTKTGTGTLTLSGSNTYTGLTVVNEGRLLVSSATAMQSTSGLTVGGSGTFDFVTGSGGSLTLPALTLNNGASLGMEMGSSTGSLIINPAAVVSTDAAAVVNIRLHPINGQATPASSTLISAPGGGLTSNGTTYTLGAVYNTTDFTVTLQATDTQLTATTTAATPLANAYWFGGFAGDNDAWAASDGSTQSNWVMNADGTGSTGLVPGAGTNVFFSATGGSLPATTELGASMDILSLTINTATALTLNSPDHRLTIHGNAAITVADGAGAVTLNTMLDLEGTAPVISVDNTGGLTLAGEISGSGGLTKTGTGTLTLGASVNLYSGRTSVLGGTLAIGSEAALGGTGENLVTDYLLIDGGTLRAMESFALADAKRGITLGSNGGGIEVDAGKTLQIPNGLTGPGGLTKSGDGTLELSAVNTYTGITYLNAGTLALLGGNNRLPANARLDAGGSSTLDLGGNSQSLSLLQFTTGVAPTLFNITGNGGSLTVNNSGTATSFTSTDQTRPLTVDMSGLSSFTHNGGTQTLRVGLTGSGHSAQGATAVVTVTLAQTNTITAGSFLMGDQVGASGGGLSSLYLGQTNTLNFSSIAMASSRSSALLTFAPGLIDPTVKIRGNNGTAALGTWNMGAIGNFTNNVWTSTADFSAGSLDALITTLTVGRASGRAGTMNSTFIMGAGTLVVTNLNLGQTAGANDTSGTPPVPVARTREVNSLFELNGPGTVTVTNLMLADNTATSTLGSTSANGSLLMRGGTFNVGAGGINMVTNINTDIHTAHGTLDLRGGTLSVGGNIFKNPTGAGPALATLILNGGTLNLNGNSIGTAARPLDVITLQAGVLENVSEINGGGSITKSGSSTDILRLTGTHTYSGSTTVTGGSLFINGSHTGGGAYTVQTGATLGGSGSLALASGAGVSLDAGATLSVGDGTLGGQTLQLETAGLGQVSFTDSSSTLTLDLFSRPSPDVAAFLDESASSDLLVVDGGIALNEARLVIADPNGIASTFAYEDTWRIFDWSNVSNLDLGTGSNVFTIDPLLDLPALSNGHFWDLSDLYIGGTITVVPEPGRAGLLLIALGFAFFRRRRR